MRTLVLLRHGESEWNSKGLFTGWVDVGLSAAGAQEAVNGGKLLARSGLRLSKIVAGLPRINIGALAPLLHVLEQFGRCRDADISLDKRAFQLLERFFREDVTTESIREGTRQTIAGKTETFLQPC